MGDTICQGKQRINRETDPEVIARRNALFQKYVTPYYNMIYKLCIKYSFNSQDVEENYNEVLVNFYRRIETYDPERSIHTWLHICTKRQIWALEKKRLVDDNRNRDNDIDVYPEDIEDSCEPSGNSMDLNNYRELYNDDILAVLDEMKPIHRDALLLQEAGYTLKEIVEIEYEKGTLKSKNIETVQSRLFHARRYLKAHLTRDGDRISGQANMPSICKSSKNH